MDGVGVTAGVVGTWSESLRGFFTPATLFLVVNLVIGTIALTSRSHQRRRRGGIEEDAHGDNHHRGPPLDREDQPYYGHEQQQYVPPLARTSSVLDRIRSIGLYRFRSGDFPPEYGAAVVPDSQAPGDAHHARSWSEPAPVQEKKKKLAKPVRMKKSSSEARKVAPAAARVVQAPVLVEEEEENFVGARAVEFLHPPEQQEDPYYQEEYVPPLRPAPLARTSSVLDHLRSFSLYRFRSGDLAPEQHDAPPAAADDIPAEDGKKQVHYGRTRSEPSQEQRKKQQQGADARTMTKSSSTAPRKPAAAAQAEAEPESVDARADSFINSFRQQLHLQRLNSLLNYKEMLNRGA